MLKTSNISFAYPHQEEITFPEIDLADNENLLILGPSGCGKTTLLHLLGGLLKPSTGHVVVQDSDITTMGGTALDRFRGKGIGIIFQTPHLLASLRVRDNIQMAAIAAGLKVDHKRTDEILDHLNITQLAHKKIHQLSIGEQQRVNIARAIYNNPKLILADEPTASLDDGNAERVITLLLNCAKAEQANLVVVTHDHRLKPHFKNILEL